MVIYYLLCTVTDNVPSFLKHYCVGYAKARVSIVQLRCVGSNLTINRSVQHIGIQCAGFVKSEVLTEANIQITVYWHVTPFSLVHRDQNFGGNCWPPEGHTHNRILIIEIPLVLICAVLFDMV
jgi:hypothetical protein